jgi:hypothetical protein
MALNILMNPSVPGTLNLWFRGKEEKELGVKKSVHLRLLRSTLKSDLAISQLLSRWPVDCRSPHLEVITLEYVRNSHIHPH